MCLLKGRLKLPVSGLGRTIQVTDEKGRATQYLSDFSDAIALLQTIIGTGSPEGVIEAQVGREYLDTAGGVGAVKYIKQLSNIGGDRKQGWVAI